MIVYVYPADTFGCGQYRMIFPAQALAAQGVDVRIVEPGMKDGVGGELDMHTGRLVRAAVPGDADVVVMQRVSMINLVDAVPMLRAQGVAVVVDMDDDMGRIDPNNPAFAGLHPRFGRNPKHNWNFAAQACRAATAVTVSTPELLRVYASHGRGTVLENRVPAAYLRHERVDSDLIGWPGSVHSHPLDLQQVGPAIARLGRAGFGYRGVGSVVGLQQALGLDAEPDTCGDVEFTDWPAAVAQLGVGLAPLADTAFNGSKSWLKLLEMSAVGVPWVASPRAEYQRYATMFGGGVLAETPKDWFKQVGRLCRDATLRQALSEAGRRGAALNTYEGHAWRWAEVWEAAMKVERRARPALRGVS